jgi:aryl-alcohol dehydrogenase-like predicted oxidoreductase
VAYFGDDMNDWLKQGRSPCSHLLEHAAVPGTSIDVSRVAIGTWAIGGWMWGGTDEAESIATIRAAVERGINIIDTAPAYGFGRSEEIVGRALAEGKLRSRVLIATKVGLESTVS